MWFYPRLHVFSSLQLLIHAFASLSPFVVLLPSLTLLWFVIFNYICIYVDVCTFASTSISSNAICHALGYNLSFCIGVAHKIASPTTNYTPTKIRSQVNNLTCSNPLAINNMMSRVLMLLLLENVPRHPPKSHPYPHNTSSSIISMD